MQSSKVNFISKYNELIQLALSNTRDFSDKLCDFVVEEYDLEAAVLFRLEGNNFEILGKSAEARKSYLPNSSITCTKCGSMKFESNNTSFDTNSDCEIKVTDAVINEGCLHLSILDNDRILLKVAKKGDFSQSDKDNFITIGEAIKNLLRIWMGKKGGLNSPISNILSAITHELRTPTNSIMGFASLLLEENLSPSQSEYVNTLKGNAFDLLSLQNDLIDIAKLESDKKLGKPAAVNVKQFINEIVKLFESKLDEDKVSFILSIDENLPDTIKFDNQKLRYILIALITNSLRLTEKGKISISVFSSEKNRLRIRITDTGIGISSEKIPNLFEPFELTETYVSNVGNISGLGLSLTKRYVDYINGDIDVSSTVGKGTTITLTIPVEEISAIEAQISSLPKPGVKKKVLVVEDDYATSKLLGNYLNKWGYEPTIVNSAEQTMQVVSKESFLAILMDIVLPDANGLELLQKLRDHSSTKRTPVIICSVEAEQQKAFLMGAVEYFVKPINYKYLVEVLTSYSLRKDSNVLIVDDDIPTLNLLMEAVQQAGFQAVAESDSTKVMETIENMKLDLAIIDLDMPEIGGVDLIELIKSKSQFANLPIIIYTGKENYEEDVNRIDGLFDSLLQKKSTNIEELQETINAMINRYEEPSSPEELKEKKDVTKILLVEDYKHSQIIVTRLLKKNNFESIVVVENGQEALEAVKEQHYDLILMDMQMPVMNGFEATRKIRELNEYRDTPIIALTAFAMKGDKEKCLDAGATDYIPKPIDSQEFIQKVKYYIDIKVEVKS